MALTIEHAEAERLAQELAAATGETLPEAVAAALRERLQRQQDRRSKSRTAREVLEEVRIRLSRVRVLDSRPPDEIIGYDENGLPL